MTIKFSKILSAALLVTFMTVGNANAQTKMIVTPTTGGTAAEYALTDVKSLTFGRDNFVVNEFNANASTFLFKKVQSIKFQTISTSIEHVTQLGEKLSFACFGDMLHVQGWSQDKTANITVFNISGQTIASVAQWNGEPINMNGASSGIYLIKINNKTYKFIKQR